MIQPKINVNFDFTMDSPKYWDGFWERNNGLGGGGCDPDSASPMLQEYHRILWSKQLPNGQIMNLEKGSGSHYLYWNDFRFGSDSIIVSFRYKRYANMIESVKNTVDDYKSFLEGYLHKSSTIGGHIIFPRHQESINQTRGKNRLISDRWDLTLECIRRFYENVESPLSKVLESDCGFFELFEDFKGYVDFFFLQDCVSSDYKKVDIWQGKGDFSEEPLPKTVKEYLDFIDRGLVFLEKRNARIEEYCYKNNL
ncbi:MAG: hypothetical protein K5769_11920 [Pseudobutyrivibrio sp.]|nr:hypothetical protein [Pseudobutyrivibrio sp.]